MNALRFGIRHKHGWLPAAACLAAVLLIRPVQDRIEARMNRASMDPDILYFSSPAAVKALALGYDSLLADIYWMRAIQYYGRRDEAERRQVRYKNLPALLDIITTLDPKMLDVYRAGSIFLGEPEPLGAGRPLESIRLLDKGIEQLPQEWRLHFDKGFAYYLYLKDHKRAGEVWLEASRIAGAPPWMKGLAARAFSEGGAVETAKDLWRRQLEEATRADVKENARNHLASIQVDEQIWTLEFFIEKYEAARGSKPSRLEDLISAGFIGSVPADPSGVPYQYDPETGWLSLSPKTKMRYIPMQYDYRESYRAQLERWYKSRSKKRTGP